MLTLLRKLAGVPISHPDEQGLGYRSTLERLMIILAIVYEHRSVNARRNAYSQQPMLFSLEDGSWRELVEYALTPEPIIDRYVARTRDRPENILQYPES